MIVLWGAWLRKDVEKRTLWPWFLGFQCLLCLFSLLFSFHLSSVSTSYVDWLRPVVLYSSHSLWHMKMKSKLNENNKTPTVVRLMIKNSTIWHNRILYIKGKCYSVSLGCMLNHVGVGQNNNNVNNVFRFFIFYYL